MKKIMNWADKNNGIVKDYFKVNFPKYNLLNEISHGPFWGVEFFNDEIVINVKGDAGFKIEITMGGTIFNLWQYDKSVMNATKTSEQNIIYQLDVLKRFLPR